MKESWQRLISGLVDGELAPAERQAAEQLLRQSAPARQLYSTLKSQSDLLKKLPRLKAPIDLTSAVLAKIDEIEEAPATLPFWRAYAPRLAAAAGLLFVLSLSWMIWSSYLRQEQLAQATRAQPQPSKSAPKPMGDEPRVATLTGRDLWAVGQHVNAAATGAVRAALAGVGETAGRTVATQAQATLAFLQQHRGFQGALLAMGQRLGAGQGGAVAIKELAKPFKRLEFALPPIAAGEELALELARFAGAVKQGGLYQFDLASKEPHKTAERLVAAGAAKQVKVMVDAEAQNALKAKKAAIYHIYLENITAETFTGLIGEFDAAEAKTAAGKPADRSLHSAILDKLPAEGHKRLAADLGVPPSSLASGAHGELSMPVDKAKADDLLKPTKPETHGSGAAGSAVVFTHNPARAGKFQSKEIRAYLDHRPGPKVDRVSLLIVVHPVK